MQSRRFVVPSFGVLWMLALGSCAKDPTTAPQLSDQCITCLTKTSNGGCQLQWQACDQVRECSDYVVCQMQAFCFARVPDKQCEIEVGCRSPQDADAGDASGPSQRIAAFEQCARTTCRNICGFVGP